MCEEDLRAVFDQATLAYRMLRYGQDYVDIGQQAYEAQFAHRRLASIKRAPKT